MPKLLLPKLELHWQILIAILLAIIVGLNLNKTDIIFSDVKYVEIFTFFGTLFLNGLKMIIVPLVVSSMITGIAGMGGGEGLGRMGAKTIAFYLITSFFAILVGLIMVNLIVPGVVDGKAIGDVLLPPADAMANVSNKTMAAESTGVMGIFLRLVPPNIIAAAVEGKMLGLIFFSVLFGYYLTKIGNAYAEAQYNFWQGLFDIMMKITHLILKFAPYGVFGLVANTVTSFDKESEDALNALSALGSFVATVLIALSIHMFVTLPLILKFLAKVNPIRHFKAMAKAMLTAFSTASSSATLPLTLQCVEKNAKVSNRTSSFVLPLGATINMDGTALYECVVAVFIFQAFGYDLSFATQFLIVFSALLTSVGVAGIPAASLIAIMIILDSAGLPKEQALAGMAIIWIVDRILDMCRTSVNIFSDSCAAVVIAKSEGEEGLLPDLSDETMKAQQEAK